MYRDWNNPKERKAAKEALTRTIGNAEQKGQEDLNRSFTWDDMKQIEAVLERQEEIIEEQEKKIEDQEERIAIMTEGSNDKKVSILQSELYNCRNELCIKCGLYRRSHEGVCNGCRYRHDGEWKEGFES